jgi:hypothetical protein
LSFSWQILPIVITQVIVTDNRHWANRINEWQ